MTDSGEEESLINSTPFANVNDDVDVYDGKWKRRMKNKCGGKSCLDVLKLYFPIMIWLPKYELNWLQCDIIAGLTVGLTVIPQGLAYAQIAGLPVQYGLYSAFMGGFIYCIFGTSKDVTLGPTAIMSLLVHNYGNKDPIQAVLLTFLAGIIQFGLGLLRLGFIMRFISVPVISGFTSAAAITIGFGQLKHIFGVKTTSQAFIPQFIEMLKGLKNTNIWDFTMGSSCIICLTLLRYVRNGMSPADPEDRLYHSIAKKFIWLMSIGRNAIVVISAGLVGYAVHTQSGKTHCKISDCLTLTGPIEEGLPDFEPPDFQEINGNSTVTTNELVSRIGIGLLVVPFMGLLESIAIGKSFARKNGYTLDINQDMIAIGISNIFSSFVSSYCITGSFSRTAINAQSNVKTPAGGIFTGALVIVSLALLTPSFYFIPKSALAAVIICAVIYMVDLHTVKLLWNVKRIDLIPLVVTFLVCFWQIPFGILAGIAVSMCIMLYPNTFPRIETDLTSNNRSMVVTLEEGLYYSAAEYVTENIRVKLYDAIKKGSIDSVIIVATNLTHLDYTSLLSFVELANEVTKIDVVITFAGLKIQLIEELQNADQFSAIRFVSSVSDLLDEE